MIHLTFLEKKFVFQSEISTYSLILFFKNIEISSAQGVVQIKPNWEWSIPCVGRAQEERKFWYSLPRKEVGFSYGNLRLFQIIKFKKRSFDQVKESFKVNQIDIPDYQYYFGCNAKRMARLTFLEKILYFNRKYRLIRLFYFQKYRNFIGSRSWSNQTKLGMEYPLCRQSIGRKEILV